MINGTFALTLAGFSRLFSNRFVWEYPNPNFTLSLKVTVYGNTGGFDLI
jgi:hypothetical protein